MQLHTRWLSLLAVWLVVASCGSDGGGTTTPPPPPPQTLATLEIAGVPSTFAVGETVQLSIVSRTSTGSQIANPAIGWSSTVPTVATVSSRGQVTGIAAGQTTIRATGAGKTAEAVVTIVAATPTVVSLLPATVALAPGGSAQLIAAVLGADGVIPGLPVTYQSSNTAIATVDASGSVTAVTNGLATITARHGSLTQKSGVTVSDQSQNVRIARLDIIQVAQTAEANVPIVQGKPSAVRIYPVASEPGGTGVTIDVRIARNGGTVFQQRIVSDVLPTSFAPLQDGRAIYLPLPVGLDLNGASISATIDPDETLAEADEFDNDYPSQREPAQVLTSETLFPIRVHLVAFAPAGQPLPPLNLALADQLVTFMAEIYPTVTVNVSVGGGLHTTGADWNSGAGVTQALNQLQIQRTQDGSTAHYYGVTSGATINGAAGWGRNPGSVSMGWADPRIVAHEVGHNLGLSHPAGCGNGTPGAPGAVIGLPGYNPLTEAEVPSSAVSVMSYCPGYVWIQPTAYRTILFQRRNATSLRTAPVRAPGVGQAVVVMGRVGPGGELSIDDARTAVSPRGLTPDAGPLGVSLLDANGVAIFRWRLAPTTVASEPGGADAPSGFAGVIPVPPLVAPRVVSVAIELNGQVTVRAVRIGG